MSVSPGPGAVDQRVVSGERARALLAEGAIEVLGRVPWASNVTLLVAVCHEDLTGLAVYKPARGERPLWDFAEGTLYRREVAAYLVSEFLGWGLVPLTIARDGPFGVGSLQLYVDADPAVTAFELVEAGHAAMPRIAAFDVVANNADRKAGHCLLAAGNRVFAIDHGVCFHTEPKLRTVLWDFAGQPLEPAVAADLGRLAAAGRDGELAASLEGTLDGAEVEAVARRAARLARAGVLPAPGPGRPYPWPLV